MSLDGLQTILKKEEIVNTQRARVFLEDAQPIDALYQEHVRTYVPVGRQAQGASRGNNVDLFEKRVIDRIRGKGSLTGYITAEYGHGKTSTALYLWSRAREQNILTVPPFQLGELSDLVTATYGWFRYEVGRTRPNSPLLDEAKILYQDLTQRTTETMADKANADLDQVERLLQHYSRTFLDITADDYLDFFAKMTHLTHSAGYTGLLVIADEVQQYIEQDIKGGSQDPVGPLFDIISGILGKTQFNFGLVLVIPPKEVSILNDQRADLVQRMSQASLDLSTVYDHEFPQRLWGRLAKEFDFEEHRDRITIHDTLESLGQIAVRDDLSGGPRTVINVFQLMAQRYLDLKQPQNDPYTPNNLIEDYITGSVRYRGRDIIPRVVSQALEHPLVRGNPNHESAIKWTAAFPTEGITRAKQQAHGLTEAFESLIQSTQNELLASVGDIRNPAWILRGLSKAPIETDTFSKLAREFFQIYRESSSPTRERAIKAFQDLLTTKVFRDSDWKVSQTIQPSLMCNAGLILEGEFRSFAQRFPKRRVYVRILWEDEAVKEDALSGVDVVVECRLRMRGELAEDERQTHASPIKIDFDTRLIALELNLLRQEKVEAVAANLQPKIRGIIPPYKWTPLLFLALHNYIDERRARNLIPKSEDALIQHGLQPALIDAAFYEMFNATVGEPVGAAEERIVELALSALLDRMYPDYSTLLCVPNWQSNLKKYAAALNQLAVHQRQGKVDLDVEMKDDLADLFTVSVSTLDNFIQNFSVLLKVKNRLPTRAQARRGAKGAVRFTLHDLEKGILNKLKRSSKTEQVLVNGEFRYIQLLDRHSVDEWAASLGYRDEEIEAIIGLMEARELIEQDKRRRMLREKVAQVPTNAELRAETQKWIADLATLSQAFPESPQLRQWREEAEDIQRSLTQKTQRDDTEQILMQQRIQDSRRQLEGFANERRQRLKTQVSKLRSAVATNPNLRISLETVITGQVAYVKSLNDLRLELLREQMHLDNEGEKLRSHIGVTETELNVESVSFTDLAHLVEVYHRHEQNADALKAQRETLGVRFGNFARWQTLVETGSTLMGEFRSWGGLVAEERARFDQVVQRITEHLDQEQFDALSHAPDYQAKLDEIATNVRQQANEASNRFVDLQKRYRQALIHALDLSPELLWFPHQYNPTAPEDSYTRLVADVRVVLIDFHDQLRRAASKLLEDVRLTLQSPALSVLPPGERDQLQQDGRHLSEDLEQIVGQLMTIKQSIDDTVIKDFPKDSEGQFAGLLSALKNLNGRLAELRQSIITLNHQLQSLELTPLQQDVFDAIQSNGTEIEIGELRQMMKHLSEPDFWSALNEIHAKRRVRVIVSPVRYDE